MHLDGVNLIRIHQTIILRITTVDNYRNTKPSKTTNTSMVYQDFSIRFHFQHPGANEEGLQWFVDLATKYKTMIYFWFGPLRPNIIMFHPDPVKDLLKTAEPKVGRKEGGYRNLLPWLGKVVIRTSQSF